jgi:hypothetical protein
MTEKEATERWSKFESLTASLSQVTKPARVITNSLVYMIMTGLLQCFISAIYPVFMNQFVHPVNESSLLPG